MAAQRSNNTKNNNKRKAYHHYNPELNDCIERNPHQLKFIPP
jgi:hypothetical protein